MVYAYVHAIIHSLKLVQTYRTDAQTIIQLLRSGANGIQRCEKN